MLDTKSYKKLPDKNITKTYKKTPAQTVKSVESSQSTSKQVAERLCIADRVNTTAKIEPFISLKDHKPNFQNNPTCRLINPCNSEIGKISKQILDRINTKVIEAIDVNQWKNTSAVLSWFTNITNKSNYSFIAFDVVVDFYPSISIDLLAAALNFSSN